MAYTKTNWQDLPSQTTPINATNLNNIETGIEDNDKRLNGTSVAGDMVVESIRTKNMFDKNAVVYGYYISETGVITTYSTTFYSDFIPVKPSTQYTITGKTTWTVTALYDSSKTFISRISDTNLTTTSSTYYIRTIGLITEINNIQVEEGSTATAYSEYQDLNPDVSGLDNDGDNYGGLAKRSVVANSTTYTVVDPNYQNTTILRNAIVTCGDSGIMVVRWSGNNSSVARIVWSYLTDGKTCTFSHNSGVLTFTFSATVYGGVNVLFMN